ncbi:MAG: hypothetical protein ACOYMA_18095 [Bacteroidia bacterium]
MNNSFEFEQGLFGTKAIIKTVWQESFLDLLLEKDVKELELNDGKGWRNVNVDFLQFLPDLRSLTIIDLCIKSIEPVHYLNKLNKIELSTYSNVPINFNSFPELIECGFEWIKGSDSLFETVSIQKLFVNRFDKKNCDSFSKLSNLHELSILNSPIENVVGLSFLKNLRTLRLANLRKLLSLQGIDNLTKIEELEIQHCRGIKTVNEVFKLSKLKRLLLLDLGEIDSIRGLENLTDLTTFLFYESTNISDGDISPALNLKNLNKISFQNRKHYSHKREDFGELYGGLFL